MPFISKIKDRLYSLKKAPPVVYWAALTALICFFIVSVSVQKADAQSISREQAEAQYKSIIQTVFDFIQRNYVEDVNPQSLYEGAMNGMFEALGDPYSAFLKEKDMAELDQNVIKGSYGGIGLYISKPSTFVEIASPIEGSPGWKAGLQPGDLIIKIGEESTAALTLDEVLARLKGAPGEKVDMTIRRGEKLEFPVTLIRAIIEVPTVK